MNRIENEKIKEVAEWVVDNYVNRKEESTVYVYNNKLDVMLNKQSVPAPIYDGTAQLIIEFKRDELSEMYYSLEEKEDDLKKYVEEKIEDELTYWYPDAEIEEIKDETLNKEFKAYELANILDGYLADGCNDFCEYDLKEMLEQGYSPNNNINVEFEIIEYDDYDESKSTVKVTDVYRI